MDLKELEVEIKKLDLQDRSRLAKCLVESLDELSQKEIEALWVEEAEGRLDDMEAGAVEEISAAEALHRARATIA